MTDKSAIILAFIITGCSILGCQGEKPDSDPISSAPAVTDQHGSHGPHGGTLLELGTAAHLEYLHDATKGRVTLYFTGSDAKSPLDPDQPPTLVLSAEGGPVVVRLEASTAAATYAASHDALRSDHPEGRISVTIAGKTYNPDLEQ
ncbi:MAG: hypothetical protein KDB53_04425, partial [Planctomycetes bacterium]|nr:hypothetical protein [Planctomycetota bacterium]